MADSQKPQEQPDSSQSEADKRALEETKERSKLRKQRWSHLKNSILIPFLAIVTAIVIGAVIVFFTAPDNKIREANELYAKGEALLPGRFQVTLNAFTGLWIGAFGNPLEPNTIPTALSGTLVQSTPYILAGLAVAFGFKAGLFNIGAEGQIRMGAIGASAVGVWLPSWFGVASLPTAVHLPLALLAGIAVGGVWAGIAGYLRAKTGAHEVITTIMLNQIAFLLVDYLIVKGPMKDPSGSVTRTPFIKGSAALPQFIGAVGEPQFNGGNTYLPLITTTNPTWNLRIHMGFLLAVGAAFFINWFLNRTPKGFEVRTVGTNPVAARYAGMNIVQTIVVTMLVSGGLAGLAGASDILGLERNMKSSFSNGFGFDSIAIALLAKSNPLAIIPAALFWAALRTGAGVMQLRTSISIDLISIIQALVIIFLAADQIVRWMYRIKQTDGSVAASGGN